MKRAAFRLVVGVIFFQLLMISGVIFECFEKNRCTGEKVEEVMLQITAQSFALYAAEK